MNSSLNLYDTFIAGMRKGWTLCTNSLLPNMIMAFAIIQILNKAGILQFLGKLCGGAMAIFGLPGEAITVLLTAWLSATGSVGVAASLYAAGVLSPEHLSIITPGIFLMGAQIQYMGRILAVAGVPSKHYKVMFIISIINAVLAMLFMRYILVR